jgi:hypothetical protein
MVERELNVVAVVVLAGLGVLAILVIAVLLLGGVTRPMARSAARDSAARDSAARDSATQDPASSPTVRAAQTVEPARAVTYNAVRLVVAMLAAAVATSVAVWLVRSTDWREPSEARTK